ncbi:hypothetical protein EYC80_003460 [Monilinia laxa]|uniref:Uncharacterized protein n=1 Tax=Monilinia laxa TaxID=61186 RepID=A0A5N6KDR3_MONLA|nr:hypothetical protein EYC80_003460 [Monilinia laxa]
MFGYLMLGHYDSAFANYLTHLTHHPHLPFPKEKQSHKKSWYLYQSMQASPPANFSSEAKPRERKRNRNRNRRRIPLPNLCSTT